MNRIYGYARASTHQQELSPELQETRFLERLAKGDILGEYVGTRKEHASATKIRWNDRPELRKLLDDLQPGDHLLVWRLDRLDRTMFGMIACVQFLVERGVYIHSLEERGGHALDLNGITGKAFLMCLAIAAEMEKDHRAEAARRSHAYRKANGLARGRWCLYGMKRIRTVDGKVIDVWDDEECQQILELVRRVRRGERIQDIAYDWVRRDIRTANNHKWCWTKDSEKRRIDATRMYDCYRWYCAMEKAGKELGDPEPLPRAAGKLVRHPRKKKDASAP